MIKNKFTVIALLVLCVFNGIVHAGEFNKKLVPRTIEEKQLLAFAKASQALQDNKFDTAKQHLEPLAPQYYCHPKRLELLAAISLQQDEPKEAIEYLLKTPSEYRDSTAFLGVLAMAYYNAELYDMALKNYNVLTLQDDNNNKWWLGLAATLDAQGKQKQALSAYYKAKTIGHLNVVAAQYINKRISEITSRISS